MFVRIPFAAVLVLGLTLPVIADEKKNEADLKAMVSSWKIQKAELGGKDLTAALKAMKFDIAADGKYSVVLGEEKDEGTFTVDASKSPKEMDIKSTGGPNKDKTIKALYKLDGDALTVCYDLTPDKSVRPEKFESKADTKVLLITYTRVKK